MWWEKLILWVVRANFVILICGSWLMLFVFMFSIGNGQSLVNSGLIQCYGYGIAFLFGGLALKKRVFLLLSLIGWGVFFFGFITEGKEVREAQVQSCLQMRQDPFCVEKSNGTMQCGQEAEIPGVFPMACEKVPK